MDLAVTLWQRLARWAVPDEAFRDPWRPFRELIEGLSLAMWQIARSMERAAESVAALAQPTARQWAALQLTNGQVHVVPVLDGEPLSTHSLAWDCPCMPSARRNGPLDDPVADHHEPTWPGADREYLQ